MPSPPGSPFRSRFTDVLDLATASTIVLGTTAFFAFIYFLPASKPKPPEQAEDRAEAPVPRVVPALAPPEPPAINIARVPAPAGALQGVPRVPPPAAAPADPSPMFDERLRAAQKHWDKGIVAYQKGDFREARKQWSLCLELKPDHEDCRTGSLRLDSNGVAPYVPSPLPAVVQYITAKDGKERRRLVVTFEKGKAAVDERAAAVLDTAAKLLHFYPLSRLRVVAYADREESE
ncbi:MAG: hypothetical protein AAB576_05560, partial [Elusimicrobiota bacterium]